MNDTTNGARIAWAYDGENFYYDSLQEAMEAYGDIGELEVGQIFHFAEVVESGTNWVRADDIIEMIGERAYDVGGEHADDFPRVTAAAQLELATFLESWQANHCVPTFWYVRNEKEYALTAGDLGSASA